MAGAETDFLETHIGRLESRNNIMGLGDLDLFLDNLFEYFFNAGTRNLYQPYTWQLENLIKNEIPELKRLIRSDRKSLMKKEFLEIPLFLLNKKYNLTVWNSELQGIMDYDFYDLETGLEMATHKLDNVYNELRKNVNISILSKDFLGREILTNKGKIIIPRRPLYGEEEKAYVDARTTEVEFEIKLKENWYPEIKTVIRLLSGEHLEKSSLFEKYVISDGYDKEFSIYGDVEKFFSARNALREDEEDYFFLNPRFTVMTYSVKGSYSYNNSVLPMIAKKYVEKIAKFNNGQK